MTTAKTVDLESVIADWEAILARVESGETITISVADRPVGQLVPLEHKAGGETITPADAVA